MESILIQQFSILNVFTVENLTSIVEIFIERIIFKYKYTDSKIRKLLIFNLCYLICA